jgi:exodeoxyribonuclease V alpha subunit
VSGGGLTPLGTASRRFRDGDATFPEALRPWLRGADLPDESLYLAWEIARLARDLDDRGRRALALLVLASLAAAGEGSTRLPLAREGGDPLDDLLARLGAPPLERRAVRGLVDALGHGAAAAVVGRAGDYKPLILDGDHLYHQRMLHFEERLVGALRARLGETPPVAGAGAGAIKGALDDVLAHPPMVGAVPLRLSDEQQAAVRAALAAPLTVISGGPGTGKTSIVVSILRALVRLDVPVEAIALAAPTGKAANRLDESVKRSLHGLPARAGADERLLRGCPEPRTLHRLLAWSPSRERFRHDEHNQLAERVVIVDECSMIDLVLMDRLVRSVRDGARLILLGDADQLPSVDAGAVLRDLLPPLVAPEVATAPPDPRARAAVRLTRSYRMDPADPAGRNILTVARLVNQGSVERLLDHTVDAVDRITVRERAAELAFERVELLDSDGEAERDAFLARWFQERVRGMTDLAALARHVYQLVDGAGSLQGDDRARVQALLAHHDRFRLLCPTRGRPTGADATNADLHRRTLDAARADGSADFLERAPALFPGEPVMMQSNDYDRGLWNGDQGVVLRVTERATSVAAGRPRVHFMAAFSRGGDVALFHLDALRADLRLSYAMTVHKAQGSEFDHVGLLLPSRSPSGDLPLLTREVLYTALTRSRRSVAIVGPRAALLDGARRRMVRFSGIGEKLAR